LGNCLLWIVFFLIATVDQVLGYFLTR
jgi:hypothetical protein